MANLLTALSKSPVGEARLNFVDKTKRKTAVYAKKKGNEITFRQLYNRHKIPLSKAFSNLEKASQYNDWIPWRT